jgi:hypothetical protein
LAEIAYWNFTSFSWLAHHECNGAVCDQKILVFVLQMEKSKQSMWIALLRKEESPVLPGEEREEAKDTVGAGGVCWQREHAFLFQMPLKPTIPHRRSTGGSQPGEGGLAHCQATYMTPKLFLLVACLASLHQAGNFQKLQKKITCLS